MLLWSISLSVLFVGHLLTRVSNLKSLSSPITRGSENLSNPDYTLISKLSRPRHVCMVLVKYFLYNVKTTIFSKFLKKKHKRFVGVQRWMAQTNHLKYFLFYQSTNCKKKTNFFILFCFFYFCVRNGED